MVTKKSDSDFDKDTHQNFEFTLGNNRLDEGVLHLILEHSHDAVVLIGNDFKFEFVSEEGYKMMKGTPDELIGRSFLDYIFEFEKTRIKEYHIERLKGGNPPSSYETQIIDFEGNILYVDLKVSQITNMDGTEKTLVLLRDRTDEELSQAALRGSEQRYRTLVETMNDGLVIDDANFTLVYANDAFCKMLGYEPDEIVGKAWLDLTTGTTPEVMESKIANRRKGESERYELQWRTKHGDTVPTIISAVPLFDENGVLTGTFGVVTDITAQKEAEDTIQFYLDLLTHDVANQLQVIMTSSGLIDSDLPKAYVEDARHDIVDAVQRCDRLITKVKRAAQTRILPRTKMDLSTVVKEKAAVLERVYSAEVSIKGLDDAIIVWADALLGELIWNLLENAARHNPSDDKKIWISLSRRNGSILLNIGDNGPGVSDAKKENIFDKSRRSGGVGLTLVYQMARKYGGSIKVDDRVKGDSSKGAKFILALEEVKQK